MNTSTPPMTAGLVTSRNSLQNRWSSCSCSTSLTNIWIMYSYSRNGPHVELTGML